MVEKSNRQHCVKQGKRLDCCCQHTNSKKDTNQFNQGSRKIYGLTLLSNINGYGSLEESTKTYLELPTA